MTQIAGTAPPAFLPTIGVWLRVGVVLLLAWTGLKLWRRGLPLDVERAMLQNAWVIVSIYACAVAADALLPVGHILSSLAGLMSGLVASQSVLYILSRQALLEEREQIIYGWAALGVGGLAIQPYVAGSVTELWILLWLLCAGMAVWNSSRLTPQCDGDTSRSESSRH